MLRVLHKSSKVMFASPTDKVEAVVALMRESGISQLPVMRGSEVVGVIAETALLRPLISGTVKATDPIESLIDNNYAMVEEGDPIERLNTIFSSGKIALVAEAARVKQILTKIDLISFLSLQTGVTR
jgi:cystathionine beta-synthase